MAKLLIGGCGKDELCKPAKLKEDTLGLKIIGCYVEDGVSLHGAKRGTCNNSQTFNKYKDIRYTIIYFLYQKYFYYDNQLIYLFRVW